MQTISNCSTFVGKTVHFSVAIYIRHIKKILGILIHPLILLTGLQHLLKQLNSIFFQLPRIHQLLLVLPPVSHASFFIHELRWSSMVFFHEVHNLFPLYQPPFVLRHTSTVIIILWPALRPEHIGTKLPNGLQHFSYTQYAGPSFFFRHSLHFHYSITYRRISSSPNGSYGPSLHSNSTVPDSKARTVCHCPAGMFKT